MLIINRFFFFFKQKTAYEMRISDWSSDVCSSDLTQNNSGSFRRQIRVPSSHNLTPHFSFTPQRDSFTIGHIHIGAPVLPDERLPVLKPLPCSNVGLNINNEDRKSVV